MKESADAEGSMLYFHSWSGGKDSTASVILDHIHNLPPSEIVISEVMFSHERNISGELPEHMEFVHEVAIPRFEKWGYKVHVVRAEMDYVADFYQVVKRSKVPERNGKYRAFPLGGMCYANRDLKIPPINNFYKQFDGKKITQYVGIAADEPKRLARLRGTNKVSLLEQFGYTEQLAYDLCKEYGLLSPVYEFTKRGGCWFCPNQKNEELARLKLVHPHLWQEIVNLSKQDNLASYGFKYGKTVAEIEVLLDAIIQNWDLEESQINLFDGNTF